MFEWKQNNHFTVFSAVWLQVRQGEQELERDGARQMEPLAIKKTKGTCIWFFMGTTTICTNLLKIAVNAAAPSQFALALSIASNCFN